MSKTVYVGMSGGVDSSVTAALLKDQDYKVVGVYMKNWTQDIGGFMCPWRQDLTDAQSVAGRLGIQLKVFDFEAEYKNAVVDYMIAEFRAGNTPNPDIMCNQEIKFKLFLRTALNDGADLIATGHYSQIKNNQLYMARDKTKDQSYFLYRVTKAALEKTLMPLGELEKTQVRKLAQDFKLPTADKPDSQGICFVGEVSLKDFLSQYIKFKTGPIKKMDGMVVGEHDGVAFYTIGQRHGLDVGGGLPFYVIDKDVKTNTVYVTDNLADDSLFQDSFAITQPHWITDAPTADKTYQVRTRYRGPLVPATLKQAKNKFIVKLAQAERAITPGQSAVVYDGEHVLGGGIITLV